MNYQTIHDRIILRAQTEKRYRKDDSGRQYELHHILMKSMGGEDVPSNLVLLTLREHFLIHCLLWKIHGTKEYRDPIFWFKSKGAANSRLYAAARSAHVLEMINDNPSLHLSAEAKLSKSSKLKAHVRTQQHRDNLSRARKGKPTRLGAKLSDESKRKIAESVRRHAAENGMSEETREKLRISNTGKKHTCTSMEKMIKSAKNRRKYACDSCPGSFDGGNFVSHLMNIHNITREEARIALQKKKEIL